MCGSGSSVFSTWSISCSVRCKPSACCLSEQRKGLDPLGAAALEKQRLFLKEETDLFKTTVKLGFKNLKCRR